MPTIIDFRGLTKRFKTMTAVGNVTLQIREGEILGLLGPNGADKTTLILTMSTVYRPDAGTVLVNGYDILKHLDSVRKMLGIAFQEPRCDEVLTVYEKIE